MPLQCFLRSVTCTAVVAANSTSASWPGVGGTVRGVIPGPVQVLGPTGQSPAALITADVIIRYSIVKRRAQPMFPPKVGGHIPGTAGTVGPAALVTDAEDRSVAVA